MTRRDFLSTAAAFAAMPIAAADSGGARLRLGVLSDIHVGGEYPKDWNEFMHFNVMTFQRALRHFRDEGVDGVVITGDLADYGMIYEMEAVAKAWFSVFPDDRLPDGRPVARLFVTGNHDWEGFIYRDFGKTNYPDPSALAKATLQGNLNAVWPRIWGEPYQPVWTKTVKGYTFVGAHWDGFPYLAYDKVSFAGAPEAIEAAGKRSDPRKPFFYLQHPLPCNTNYGSNSWGHDRGDVTAALSRFPNAFAISGHSHYSLTDDRSLWQGAFTSLSMSSLRYTVAFTGDCGPEAFENTKTTRPEAKGLDGRKMMPRASLIDGRQGSVLTVYDDRIEITRRDFLADEPLAEDWTLPWPASERGKPFAPQHRRKIERPPLFDRLAKVEVERCRRQNRTGESKDALTVAFPSATAHGASRAQFFEVAVEMEGGEVHRLKRVIAQGFHRPRRLQPMFTECVFALDELPPSSKFRFAVTPVASFGARGEPLRSESLTRDLCPC